MHLLFLVTKATTLNHFIFLRNNVFAFLSDLALSLSTKDSLCHQGHHFEQHPFHHIFSGEHSDTLLTSLKDLILYPIYLF